MGLIKIISADEQKAELRVAAAHITFALNARGKTVEIVRMPSPRECNVPKNLLEQARALAKKVILDCRERKAAHANHPRLF